MNETKMENRILKIQQRIELTTKNPKYLKTEGENEKDVQKNSGMELRREEIDTGRIAKYQEEMKQ